MRGISPHGAIFFSQLEAPNLFLPFRNLRCNVANVRERTKNSDSLSSLLTSDIRKPSSSFLGQPRFSGHHPLPLAPGHHSIIPRRNRRSPHYFSPGLYPTLCDREARNLESFSSLRLAKMGEEERAPEGVAAVKSEESPEA